MFMFGLSTATKSISTLPAEQNQSSFLTEISKRSSSGWFWIILFKLALSSFRFIVKLEWINTPIVTNSAVWHSDNDME